MIFGAPGGIRTPTPQIRRSICFSVSLSSPTFSSLFSSPLPFSFISFRVVSVQSGSRVVSNRRDPNAPSLARSLGFVSGLPSDLNFDCQKKPPVKRAIERGCYRLRRRLGEPKKGAERVCTLSAPGEQIDERQLGPLEKNR